MATMPETIPSGGLWASLSEGRAPRDGEVESFAAKVWRDVYRGAGVLSWNEVEIGSVPHRRSIAAALAALGAITPEPRRGG